MLIVDYNSNHVEKIYSVIIDNILYILYNHNYSIRKLSINLQTREKTLSVFFNFNGVILGILNNNIYIMLNDRVLMINITNNTEHNKVFYVKDIVEKLIIVDNRAYFLYKQKNAQNTIYKIVLSTQTNYQPTDVFLFITEEFNKINLKDNHKLNISINLYKYKILYITKYKDVLIIIFSELDNIYILKINIYTNQYLKPANTLINSRYTFFDIGENCIFFPRINTIINYETNTKTVLPLYNVYNLNYIKYNNKEYYISIYNGENDNIYVNSTEKYNLIINKKFNKSIKLMYDDKIYQEFDLDVLYNRTSYIKNYILDFGDIDIDKIQSLNFKHINIYKEYLTNNVIKYENKIYYINTSGLETPNEFNINNNINSELNDGLYYLYEICNFLDDVDLNYLADMIINYVKYNKFSSDKSLNYLELLLSSNCDSSKFCIMGKMLSSKFDNEEFDYEMILLENKYKVKLCVLDSKIIVF